jgi:hypothetical protein
LGVYGIPVSFGWRASGVGAGMWGCKFVGICRAMKRANGQNQERFYLKERHVVVPQRGEYCGCRALVYCQSVGVFGYVAMHRVKELV